MVGSPHQIFLQMSLRKKAKRRKLVNMNAILRSDQWGIWEKFSEVSSPFALRNEVSVSGINLQIIIYNLVKFAVPIVADQFIDRLRLTLSFSIG